MKAKTFLEIVEKFNPYHGKDGRFTTSGGATSFTYAPGKSKAHDKAIAREKIKDNPYRDVPMAQLKSASNKYHKQINDALDKVTAFENASKQKGFEHAFDKKIAAHKKVAEKAKREAALIDRVIEYKTQYPDKKGKTDVPF